MLYEELDDVELEHTSMVLDLSIVPDDISFGGREVRDSYSAINSSSDLLNGKYKPPSFIVDALQHTSVECSWDTDKQREKKLTNFSLWRNLNESELQQYVASSDSDDSEIEQNNNKSKVKSMRKMLLGDELAESRSDSDLENDDFFNSVDDDETDHDHAGERELTYIPELENGFKNRETSKEKMTPYETDQQKTADRKKARKLMKKITKAEKLDEVTITNEDKSNGQLELLMADDVGYVGSKNDFDMREIELREKEQQKRSKKQKRKIQKLITSNNTDPSSIAPEDTFKLDVTDSRFSKLFQGDPRFGIDKTANEFRSTPATAEILEVQIKNRMDTGGGLDKKANQEKEPEKSVNVSSLIKNLKRKFG